MTRVVRFIIFKLRSISPLGTFVMNPSEHLKLIISNVTNVFSLMHPLYPSVIIFLSSIVTITIISAEPVFTVRPSAARVGLNGIAKFDCVARGNPPPSVFWAKEVYKLYYFILASFFHTNNNCSVGI